MIKIELRLFGNLRRFIKDIPNDESSIFSIDEHSTIQDTLEFLQMPVNEIKIILVNGKPNELSYPLREGDRVAIFPAVVGG